MLSVQRAWINHAVKLIEADFNRSSDTHLIRIDLKKFDGITLYLKDESSHPTASLKHRLARSLFLYALCNEWIGPKSTLIESSSGSTAVSEAYFAKLLNLKFIAVIPSSTAITKIEAIKFYGGEVHLVDDPNRVYEEATRLAKELNGHYLDQFTFAERVTDWRGNNNIADSIFLQMSCEESPEPEWIVCGAGTGGTSATIGRYIRYKKLNTKLCLADPEGSVFHKHWKCCDITNAECANVSLIEGIGRPRVEKSFIPSVIDRTEAVSDTQSIGSMRAISLKLGRAVGGSTGTNIWACKTIIEEMARNSKKGSVVTLLCDSGNRYSNTYYDDVWLANKSIDCNSIIEEVTDFLE